jgi:uncharacterized protein (DUF433 family)
MDVSTEHIEIVEGAGGPKPRIIGHRIRVEDVVIWHEEHGMTAAEIVEHYPTITIADVYGALAYYWDHKDELDRRWAEDRAWAEEYERTHVGPLERLAEQRRVG